MTTDIERRLRSDLPQVVAAIRDAPSTGGPPSRRSAGKRALLVLCGILAVALAAGAVAVVNSGGGDDPLVVTSPDESDDGEGPVAPDVTVAPFAVTMYPPNQPPIEVEVTGLTFRPERVHVRQQLSLQDPAVPEEFAESAWMTRQSEQDAALAYCMEDVFAADRLPLPLGATCVRTQTSTTSTGLSYGVWEWNDPEADGQLAFATLSDGTWTLTLTPVWTGTPSRSPEEAGLQEAVETWTLRTRGDGGVDLSPPFTTSAPEGKCRLACIVMDADTEAPIDPYYQEHYHPNGFVFGRQRHDGDLIISAFDTCDSASQRADGPGQNDHVLCSNGLGFVVERHPWEQLPFDEIRSASGSGG